MKNNKLFFQYCGIVVVCFMLIFVGHALATHSEVTFSESDKSVIVKAKVVEVMGKEYFNFTLSEGVMAQNTTISFLAQVVSGPLKGSQVEAKQNLDYFTPVQLKDVAVGDSILLYSYPSEDGNDQWLLSDYVRFDTMLLLGLVFFGLLLLFGRGKGLKTIMSLSLTCLAIFYVLIPAILNGQNIYLWAITVCCYVIVMTLFIVNGLNKKSIASILGCFGGVLTAGILTLCMDQILMLTGVVNEDAVMLLNLNKTHPIDLRAIIFAAIIIGAMGAIMDVSISISSALSEIYEYANELSFMQLLNSGINIGRDIMGTMANTLILAYIGSSLSIVLLLVAYNSSLLDLLNREMIIVELLQALVGSIGILCTIPLTSLVCATLFIKNNEK